MTNHATSVTMKSPTFLLLFCAVTFLAGIRPLPGAILFYELSGVVQAVDRDAPPSLYGAPAVMILSYDTDSLRERYPYADTANRSMLASGVLGVADMTISSFYSALLYEMNRDPGDHLFLASDTGYGVVLDGDFTLSMEPFPEFQPDGRLFAGTQFTGNVGSSGVIFSSPGLPADTNNEGVSIAWHSITLIPEPSAALLCTGLAVLTLRRRRDGDTNCHEGRVH